MQSFNELSTKNKILGALAVLLLVYFFIAAEMGLPPASYAIDWYCNFFETDNYPPMLIAVVLFFPIAALFGFLSREPNK